MTAGARIHAIRIYEKAKKNPQYAAKMGITADVKPATTPAPKTK